MGGFVIDHLAETLFCKPCCQTQTLESMLKKHAAGGSFFLGRDIFLNHLF